MTNLRHLPASDLLRSPTPPAGPLPWRTLASITLVLALAGCAHTAKLTPLAEVEETQMVGRGGIKVSLPKTMVTIDATIVHIHTKPPGEYADLALPILGLDPIPPSSTFSLDAESVTIGTFGKPDPNQTYWLEFSGGPFVTNEVSLTLDPHGVMNAGASGQENKTVDFILATVGSVATIAGTVAKSGISAQANDPSVKPEWVRAFLSLKAKKNPALGKEDLQADVIRLLGKNEEERNKDLQTGSDSLRNHWKQWIEVAPEYRRILRTVARIGEVASSITAAANNPIATKTERDAAIKDYNKELSTLLEPFIGAKVTTPWKAQWTIDPADKLYDPAPRQNIHLLTLIKEGPEAGIKDIRNGVKPSLPSGFRSSGKTAQGIDLDLILIGTKPSGAKAFAKLEKKRGPRGFRYRIPAETEASVEFGSKTLASEDLLIAQYGYIGYLPRSTGSATTKWDIALDPVTGALTKLSLNNKAFDPALVKQAGAAANDFLMAATTDRELLKAQREANLLRARKDAMESRKALSEAAAEHP